MKAFEDSTDKPLEEEKKEIASEELIITGTLGEDIGADKATGIINDIKIEIIKNNTKDTVQIAETINNVTNNYNVTLNIEQQKDLESLMTKIAKQDYNYKEMKNTLNSIKKSVDEKLDSIGEGAKKDFFEIIKSWFESVKDWFKSIVTSNNKELSILENTNDSILGENTIIDATSEETINNIQSNETTSENLLSKIWKWFIGLFNKSDNENIENENIENDSEKISGTDTQIEEFSSYEEHFDTNSNGNNSGDLNSTDNLHSAEDSQDNNNQNSSNTTEDSIDEDSTNEDYLIKNN